MLAVQKKVACQGISQKHQLSRRSGGIWYRTALIQSIANKRAPFETEYANQKVRRPGTTAQALPRVVGYVRRVDGHEDPVDAGEFRAPPQPPREAREVEEAEGPHLMPHEVSIPAR